MRSLSAFFTNLTLAVMVSVSAWAQSPVQMSILPNARSAAPNEAVTFFATIVNSGDIALSCQPRFGGFFPGAQGGQAKYFPWDGSVITGTANQAVDIPSGGRQDYVVEITVPNAFTGQLFSNIQCTGDGGVVATVPRLRLVNDFRVNIAAGNQPDIIMIGDTLSRDGVARVGETGPRAALMTMAAVNIGGAATNFIIAPEVTGYSTLHNGYQPTICETDASGVCTGPEDTSVSIDNWPTNEVRLFAVRMRVPTQLGVPFYPDHLRLLVRAAPDPANAGADRPADFRGWEQLLDAMFGGYGSAVSAPRQAPYQDSHAPVQQCSTQPDGDTEGDWRRSGGMLMLTPAEPGGTTTASGYLEFSDLSADLSTRHLIPVSVDVPSEGGAGTVTLHGSGAGSAVTNDVTYPVNAAAPDATGNLRLTWTAQPGGVLDFRRDGSARCAAAPAHAIAATRPRTARESAFTGTSAASPVVAGIADILVNNGQVSGVGGTPVLLTDMQPHTPPIPALTQQQIGLMYDASMTAFRGAAQVGYEAVFVPSSWRILDKDPDINCGVLGYSGTAITSGQGTATDDAGTSTLTGTDDDPIELGDGECIQ